MKTYKAGIIGYGAIAAFHCKKVVKPENYQFTGAFDIDMNRKNAAVGDGLKFYNTQEALLTDGKIDIILVATPNNSHKDIAISAMKAGKHVICEKPVSLNSTELEEMIKVAEENNVIFTVHQNRRWDKDFRIIHSIYNSYTLGDIFRIESRVQGSRGIADTWRRRKEYGGGMMYDWGVHLIDQILHLVQGKVTSVFTEFQYISQEEVDDNFRLILKFENGLSVLIEVGTCNYIMLPIWYMCGKKGTAQIDYWDLKGKITKLKKTDIRWDDEIPNTVVGPSKTLAPRAGDTVEEMPLPVIEVEEGLFYNNFIHAVEGKEELLVKPEEALRVMKVIDLAFEAGRENKVIKCNI